MPLRRIVSTSITVTLFILIFAAGFIATGCAPVMKPEPEWEKSARAELDHAEALFSKRLYDQAARNVDGFFKLYPTSRYRDRALHLKGDIFLTKRDYRNALLCYKELIEKYPASSYIVDTKYKLGLSYFELKEYDLAAANLQDRSRITDPVTLKRISEMLSAAYTATNKFPEAVKEYTYLLGATENEQQRIGYRERIREIVEKNLNEDGLRKLASGSVYPADIAQLRLAALLIEQRKYRDAADVSKHFLERFPAHPERTRAEMLLNDATTKLTSPRYSIGVLVPQSGQLSFFGDSIIKGVTLAVHTYNLAQPDNRVDVITKDTEGLAEKSAAGLGELASKGVVAVIGPVTTKEEETIVPLLSTLQTPVIRPAASRAGFTEKNPWLFRNGLTIDSQAQAATQFVTDQKLRRVAILYPDEPYGKDLSHLFIRSLERRAEILANIAYPPETKDFGPYVRKLMEIDLRSRKILIPEEEAVRKKVFAEYTPGFDTLYLPGNAEQVGLLLPQLAFYNITDRVVIGSANWHSPNLIERAGRHAEGAIFVDGFFPESTDPAIKGFVDAYRSAYQEEPDILSAQAYDAAMMVFMLLKEHKETRLAIRDGLLALKNYPGVSGITSFDGNGEAQKKIFFIKVENGNFTLLRNGK